MLNWIVELVDTLQKGGYGSRSQQNNQKFSRALGLEKPEDFTSHQKFEEEVNRQLDGFENYWRQGNMTEAGDFDPSFVTFDGINWNKVVYQRKCTKVSRKPIPELLEDFDYRVKRASEHLDCNIEFLTGLLQQAKANIIKKLESGESRQKIMEDYTGERASSNNKMVSVHCEHGEWKVSIVGALELLHRDRQRLLYSKLRDNPEKFTLSFSNPLSKNGERD
jgi:hypothetical protein